VNQVAGHVLADVASEAACLASAGSIFSSTRN
jgi:hypothetical protein